MSTHSNFSKLVAAFVGLSTAFTLIGSASVAEAAALTQTQIDSIVSLVQSFGADAQTVANVRASLTGGTPTGTGTGSTTTGTCAYTFATNLKQGMTGTAVLNLQKVLNQNSATQVAATGVGSAGNESSYFGAMTKVAVVKFQELYAADILTPAGLTAGNGFVGAGTRAKLNAVCSGSSTGTGTGTGTGTATGVSISSTTQPANSLAPTDSRNVPFTKFTITNRGSAVATVNNVTVERQGLASDNAFSSIVLLDENGSQVGITKILNSNHQSTIGEAVTLQPGQSRTFTVAANIGTVGTTYAGQVASFAVVAVNTSATVSGSLPIVGASHTLNGSLSIGTITVARGILDPATQSSKEIGTTGYKFTSVKVTAGSAERAIVKSIRFNQSGSAASADLANVKVSVDSNVYVPTLSVDGKYYTANFGTGIIVDKGLSKEFTLSADIASGAGRTASFDIYKSTDIVAVGETYGYGLAANDGDTSTGGTEGTYDDESTPAYNAYDVDIAAGTFNSVAKSNTVSTGNVAKQVSGTAIAAFSMNLAGEAVQVQTMKFDVTVDAGTATRSITNITLVDQNGVVLSGPVDSIDLGTAITTTNAITFSAVTIPAGVTTVTVKGQLDSDWVTDDTLALFTNNSHWTGVVGQTTGNTITLPTFSATANTQTVKNGALTATTLNTPAAGPVVAGEIDHIFMTGLLDAANSGEDIRVSSIALNDATTAAAKTADIDNLRIYADLNADGTYETLINSGDNFSDSDAGDDQVLTISLDTPLTITKNTSVKIQVLADFASNAAGTANVDSHRVGIDAVTAAGLNTGATVSVSLSGAGQAQTLQTSGTLTVSVDDSSPAAALLLDSATAQTVGVFKFAANNIEDLNVDSIKITEDGADDAVATYLFYNGTTLLGSIANSNGTAEIFLSPLALVVPKNSNVKVTVKALMNDIDGTAVQNNDQVKVTIDAAGDVDTTGKASGAAVDSTQTSVDAATHRLFEAYPTVAFESLSSSAIALGSNDLIAKIKLTNLGNKDITLNQTDADLLSIQIAVTGDDTDNAAEPVTLKDQDGNTLDTGTISSATATTQIDFGMSTYPAGITIAGGTTKTLYVYADTSDLEDAGNTIQVWLDDTAADLTIGIESTGAYTIGDKVFKNDVFGSVLTKN